MNDFEKTEEWPDAAPARMTELYDAVECLKEGHRELKRELRELEERAIEAAHAFAEGELQRLRELRPATRRFLLRLQSHRDWEEEVLHPFLRRYFNLDNKPTLLPSFWKLEKEYELAVSSMHAFTNMLDDLYDSADWTEIRQTTYQLIRSCHLIGKYFQAEERFVHPLAEQALTDIDYFYS
ncbi:hypothetical protein IJ21_27260 [Paenibacillus sp. 32O-W]|jgi:hypothetical protein|nr:hypothetical protein [Paenibacillus sp. 32O-W]ALS28122.1 hypothetical protein IJ21_27260 [Paenibacillus sp. 32O-W]